MSVKDQLQPDMTEAMKARDQLRLDTLRMCKTAIKNREVAEMRELSEAEVLQVLRSLIKQRRDSVEQYRKAGRTDLADKEAAEIVIIETYLPPEISVDQMEKTIDEVLNELGSAPGVGQMGPVMKTVMGRFAGQNVDGKMVSQLVRRKLEGEESKT